MRASRSSGVASLWLSKRSRIAEKPAKAALSTLYNAAEVEISPGVDFASYRIPLRLIGVSRPRRQRLKQHVARACKASISSTGGVQAKPG